MKEEIWVLSGYFPDNIMGSVDEERSLLWIEVCPPQIHVLKS